MKKLVLGESANIPRFERVIVAYKCGCSFYNDTWKAACESEPLCPEHGKSIKAESGEWVNGARPDKAITQKHTLKVSVERAVIDMKDVLEQRQRDGKPLIIIETQTTSKEVVEALKKCLPEDQKHKVTLVNFDNNLSVEESQAKGIAEAKACIESGTPVMLIDEAKYMFDDIKHAEIMGWNSMVFSQENNALKNK